MSSLTVGRRSPDLDLRAFEKQRYSQNRAHEISRQQPKDSSLYQFRHNLAVQRLKQSQEEQEQALEALRIESPSPTLSELSSSGDSSEISSGAVSSPVSPTTPTQNWIEKLTPTTPEGKRALWIGAVALCVLLGITSQLLLTAFAVSVVLIVAIPILFYTGAALLYSHGEELMAMLESAKTTESSQG